jgi:hypothetical protein
MMGCKAAGEENALFGSGPLRPAFEKEVLYSTFGFQAFPVPSLCGSANLYRLAAPEQRLRGLNRGPNGLKFGD